MRIALLQINPTAGDLKGNAALIVRGIRAARSQGADLAVTPELALMGYLPRDLLMNRDFVRRGGQALAEVAAETKDGPPALVGVATPNPSDMGRPLFNSALLVKNGSVGPAFHKTLLPTYDVFDEDRYFEPAQASHGSRVGVCRARRPRPEDLPVGERPHSRRTPYLQYLARRIPGPRSCLGCIHPHDT